MHRDVGGEDDVCGAIVSMLMMTTTILGVIYRISVMVLVGKMVLIVGL